MNCPYCGSTTLTEASNFNEFSCDLCKCEFRQNPEQAVRIFEEGNYVKFCENVMYSLCEKTDSPKLTNVIVSVMNQLKNKGIEEIDTMIEHFNLIASNLSSEVAMGWQSVHEENVIKEAIDRFTTLGNTVLKRSDLEIDLSRFTRFVESKEFYENSYPSHGTMIKSLPTVTVKPTGTGKETEKVIAGAVDEAVEPVEEEGITSLGSDEVADPNNMHFDDSKMDENIEPTVNSPIESSMAPAAPQTITPAANQPAPAPAVSQATTLGLDEMNKIAEAMTQGYRTGAISEDADFFESLMNYEAASGLCEDIGEISEKQVYEIAQMVREQLQSMNCSNPAVDHTDVTAEQLCEALDILTAAAKGGELKDL